jgi:hypothetical protein
MLLLLLLFTLFVFGDSKNYIYQSANKIDGFLGTRAETSAQCLVEMPSCLGKSWAMLSYRKTDAFKDSLNVTRHNETWHLTNGSMVANNWSHLVGMTNKMVALGHFKEHYWTGSLDSGDYDYGNHCDHWEINTCGSVGATSRGAFSNCMGPYRMVCLCLSQQSVVMPTKTSECANPEPKTLMSLLFLISMQFI